MNDTTGIGGSRLRRLAEMWPYILVAIAVIGVAIKVYRGTF